jgi:protein TonB
MFEHSLIDLEAKPQPRRRWISLPIAVGLHLVGLTTFALASYWSIAEVPEPPTNVVFVSLAPLPALPAGGGGRPPEKQPVVKEPAPPPPTQGPVQPTDDTVPKDVPPPATDAPIDVFTPGSTGDTDGPGVFDGPGCPDCPVGPGFGPGTGGPGVGPGGGGGGGDQPMTITVGMTRPVIVHSVQPRYTELARRAGIQGTVIVEAVIDQKGQVTNVRVLRGLPMGLDRAAVEAIQQWRFKPALLDDRPVKVFFTLTVNFSIQR